MAKPTGNPAGRPRHYDNSTDFDDMVNAYIAECLSDKTPITWTGLALSLGFAGRACIDEYAKYDGFSYSVKRAKTLVEHAYELRLNGDKPTAAIFALKNFGWKDKQEVDTDPVGALAESLSRLADKLPD
jgi:hypothetical protein